MMIKIIVSCLGGAVILLASLGLSILIDEGGYSVRTATAFRQGESTEISYDACQPPQEYQQYCDNVEATMYGHMVLVARSTKEVPPNPYINNLDQPVYKFCDPITDPALSRCEISYFGVRAGSSSLNQSVILVSVAAAYIAASCIAYKILDRYYWKSF